MRRHSLVRVARFGTRSSRHMVIRRSTAGPSTPMSFAVQITGTATRSSSRWMNTRELATGSSNRRAAPDEQVLRLVEQQQRVACRGKALRQAQPGQPLMTCGSPPSSSAGH